VSVFENTAVSVSVSVLPTQAYFVRLNSQSRLVMTHLSINNCHVVQSLL